MASELGALQAKAVELADVAAGHSEAERVTGLAPRLAAGRFLVSVVGGFKWARPTRICALVGEEVLPTGVLPLISVATELADREAGAVVGRRDGTRTERFERRAAVAAGLAVFAGGGA